MSFCLWVRVEWHGTAYWSHYQWYVVYIYTRCARDITARQYVIYPLSLWTAYLPSPRVTAIYVDTTNRICFFTMSLYQWQPVTTVVSVSNTDTSFFSSLGHVFQHSSISLLILHYNTETTRIYLFFCELQRYRVNILFFFFR